MILSCLISYLWTYGFRDNPKNRSQKWLVHRKWKHEQIVPKNQRWTKMSQSKMSNSKFLRNKMSTHKMWTLTKCLRFKMSTATKCLQYQNIYSTKISTVLKWLRGMWNDPRPDFLLEIFYSPKSHIFYCYPKAFKPNLLNRRGK